MCQGFLGGGISFVIIILIMPQTFFNQNAIFSEMLREIAGAYEVFGGDDRFRVSSYNKAADSIEHLSEDLKDCWQEGKVESIPGVGKAISLYIDEYFKTGKVSHFNSLKKRLPAGMFVLMKIPGIGPKNAYKLSKTFKIKTVKDLEIIARSGKIENLSGFGKKSQAGILEGIKYIETMDTRMLLSVADSLANKLVDYLLEVPGVLRVDPLGSLRRRVPTIGDIDLAVSTNDPESVISSFLKYHEISRVLSEGTAKASVIFKSGIQVDLRVQNPATYGAQLQYFTGSKDHNIKLRSLALRKGYSLSEYGIKLTKGKGKGRLIECQTEEEFYNALGMDWIPPELREGKAEIERALKHNLPKLVKLEDLKGDLHTHSSYSLEESHDEGVSSMEDLIEKAIELKYEYIALGNHSPGVSTHSKSEIISLLNGKQNKIAYLRKRFPEIAIFNSIEIDILADGNLSLDPKMLELIDFGIASVHSSFNQPKEKMTARVLGSLKHPKIKIFGHPTGRLIQEREQIDLDWEKIYDFCANNNKYLEINSSPNRLDLPESPVREAVFRGVGLVINSDSHDVSQMGLLRYGVDVARRGWAEKNNILNSLSLTELSAKLGLES